MIFGRMTNYGREFVLVGLDNGNLAEIAHGKPLVIGPIPGDPTLAKVQLIIMAGENDQEIAQALEKLSAERREPPNSNEDDRH